MRASTAVLALITVLGAAATPTSAGTYSICAREPFGTADLAGTPVTPQTVFEIGSTTKTFTALLAAMLVQDRQLGFDDPVRPWQRCPKGICRVGRGEHQGESTRCPRNLFRLGSRRGGVVERAQPVNRTWHGELRRPETFDQVAPPALPGVLEG